MGCRILSTLCKQSSRSTLNWFSWLGENSIDNFNNFSMVFMKHYSMFINKWSYDTDMWTMFQNREESLHSSRDLDMSSPTTYEQSRDISSQEFPMTQIAFLWWPPARPTCHPWGWSPPRIKIHGDGGREKIPHRKYVPALKTKDRTHEENNEQRRCRGGPNRDWNSSRDRTCNIVEGGKPWQSTKKDYRKPFVTFRVVIYKKA